MELKKKVPELIDIAFARAYELSESARVILDGIANNRINETPDLMVLLNSMLELGTHYIDLANELKTYSDNESGMILAVEFKNAIFDEIITKSRYLVNALKGE